MICRTRPGPFKAGGVNMSRIFPLLLIFAAAARAQEASYPLAGINETHLQTLKTYCLECHSEKGKFRVDDLPLTIGNSATAERWQKVLNALNSGQMPPEDEKQLPAQEKANLVDDLGQAMVALRLKMNDRHGEIAMSRLNRREYRNTLRELLGVEINVSQLPADHGLSNFDTNGASLFFSSNQLESYLELGREAVEEAIDRYEARHFAVRHRHEAEQLTRDYRAHFVKWGVATAWHAALIDACLKPENKEIYDALKKKYPRKKDEELPFYRHYDQIVGAPPIPAEEKYRFLNDAGRVDNFIEASAPNQAYLEHYLKLQGIETGAFITFSTIHPGHLPTNCISYTIPATWPPGKYKVRFRAARSDDAPEDRRFLEFGLRVRNVEPLSTHEVTGSMRDPQVMEASVEITRKHIRNKRSDERQLYVRERASHYQLHFPRRVVATATKRNGYGPVYALWIDWLEVERVTTEDEPIPDGMQAVARLLTREGSTEDRSKGLYEHQTGGVTGRAVRILNPDAGDHDFLHLREVQLLSGGENVALSGEATQSSTHENGQEQCAQMAIDGDLATMNHTSNTAQPGEWWQVDLGRDVEIDQIRIHNRNDSPAMEARLKNHTVEVLDANGNVLWSNALPPAELAAGFREFSTAAFRGAQPDEEFVDRLLKYYDDKRKLDGLGHRAALTHTLAIALSSPMFLYKSEASLQAEQTVSQRELAQRLSYFLWSAPADKTLLELADAGKLSDPQVLRQQTDRLLDDERATAMIHGLVHQWLDMERLDFFNVDILKHRAYDHSVELAVRDEVYETAAYVLAENRSLTDLLGAGYVVVNNLLARYYGIPDVHGDHFRRVEVPKGSPRGGLLGMAAIHLMGGNGDESSPVERGVWVLRKLLNQPPPPAPANVPNLARLSDKLLSTRERLVAHQEQAQCASCHRKIDPIGFGLENFDAVGLWRTENSYKVPRKDGEKEVKQKQWKIDSSGRIHNGPAFADYFELRDHIATHHDAFAKSFASAVIEYGMGRSIGFSDQTLIDEIAQRAGKDDYAIRSFFHAIVQHQAFQKK